MHTAVVLFAAYTVSVLGVGKFFFWLYNLPDSWRNGTMTKAELYTGAFATLIPGVNTLAFVYIFFVFFLGGGSTWVFKTIDEWYKKNSTPFRPGN